MSDKRYLRVYIKDQWTDSWSIDRQLSPVRITLSAGSAGAGVASGAQLARMWGAGVLEEGTPLVDASEFESYAGKYVKITRSEEPWGLRERKSDELTGIGEEMLFVGYIPAEQFRLLGEAGGGGAGGGGGEAVVDCGKCADHGIRAAGLEYLLERRLLWSYVKDGVQTSPDDGWKEIKSLRCPRLPHAISKRAPALGIEDRG